MGRLTEGPAPGGRAAQRVGGALEWEKGPEGVSERKKGLWRVGWRGRGLEEGVDGKGVSSWRGTGFSGGQ